MHESKSLRDAVARGERAVRALVERRERQAFRAPASARALPPRPVVLQALAWWAASRAGYLVLTAIVVLALRHQPLGLQSLLARWQQWDANWYLLIATHGYATTASAGFFPLYPLLISVVLRLPGMSALLAALLVANLASLGAMVGIGWLAATEAGELSAVPRTLAALIAYPVAYFLVAPFSEGLFLCASVFSLLYARQGWWRWTAACAFLAGFTRPTGVALIPALLWEYGRQRGWWEALRQRGQGWREALRPRTFVSAILLLAAVPTALLAVALYDWHQFGSPLLYVHAQDLYWHHAQWPLWQTLLAIAHTLLHPPRSNLFRLLVALDLSALAAAVVVLLASLRRMPVAFSLYVVAMLYLILSAPVPSRPEVVPSVARYLLAAFPLFLVVGRWAERHPRLGLAAMAAGLAVQIALAQLFLQGIWVE